MRQLAILIAIAAIAACDQQTNEPATNQLESETITPADAASNGDGAPAGDGASGGENTATPPEDIRNGEMRWSFARTARGPKLTYGEPATDNVRLTLRCDGSERVELSFMRSSAAEDGGSMIVAAGGAERELQATVEQTQLGPALVSAVALISSEPIQSFRSGSGLQVRWRGETISVPPAGEQGRQLLEACGA